jgi:hypothetical protein
MTINRLSQLLNQIPELREVNSKVRLLLSIQSALTEALPAPLAETASAASLTDGKLVLFADNGAVAAKLKQMTPRILAFLRMRNFQITGIQVQVQVKNRHNPLPQKQFSLSGPAAASISRLTRRLKPSALRTMLQNLSSRSENRSDCDQKTLEDK